MYSSNHHLKGVASEGFNKSSSSLFQPSSQALCKVCMPGSNLCVALFVRPSKERHQQGSLPIVQTSSQGLCKASRLHSPWSILLLKGSARLQQGFTIKNSCQGLCKGRLQQALLFIIQSIRHSTRNKQICTPHLLI